MRHLEKRALREMAHASRFDEKSRPMRHLVARARATKRADVSGPAPRIRHHGEVSGTARQVGDGPERAFATGARLVGIDLARLVAVVGMMAAHTLSRSEPPAAVVALIDGPPSTLFAVLGGVSVALAARSRLAKGDRRGVVRSTLARGLMVMVIGFVLIPFAPAVYVVLVPFGVALMLAAGLVLLPTWLLGALTAMLAAGSGWLVALARERLPNLDGRPHDAVALFTEPAATWSDILLTGVYPALTWMTYVAIGVLVARVLLAGGRRRARLALLALAGAILTAAGLLATEIGLRSFAAATGGTLVATRDRLLANAYGGAASTEPAWQLLAAPHAGTPADIARTVGIALLVIAALGLLTMALPQPVRRMIEPLRAAGGAPLTIYIVHVVLQSVLLALLIDVAPVIVVGWGGLALQVAVALVIGAVLAATRQRGPFERLVGRVAAGAAPGRRTAAPPA